MALAFGGLTFKLLPDNTIEVNFDGNKTNLNYRDVKELASWLSMQQQEIMYGAKTTIQAAPNNYNPNQYLGGLAGQDGPVYAGEVATVGRQYP